MSDVYFNALEHNFKVAETESTQFIYSEPTKPYGTHEKYPALYLELAKNIDKEKAWEIAYLLSEFAISFSLKNVTPDNIIEDRR